MKRGYISLVCLLFAFVLLLTSCSEKANDPAPTSSDILNVSLGVNPSSIDPAYCTDSGTGSIVLHLFEGLMSLGADGNLAYAQAAGCEISDDAKTYTFTLNEGLKWSDGRGVTAADFSYAWSRAAAVADNEGSAYLFDIIARDKSGALKVETPDDLTVTVTLKYADSYFMELLTMPAFCPVRRDVIDNDSAGWSMKSGTCITNGAYTLKTVSENSYISLEKSANYRDAGSVKTKVLNFVNVTGGTTYEAFVNGDILFADTISSSKISEAKNRAGYNQIAQYGTFYIVFNTKNELLGDPLIRAALTLAIDRNALNGGVCIDTNTPAGALIPSGMLSGGGSDYRSRNGEFIDTSAHSANIAKAKELLEDAGYPEGAGLPVITYICNSGAEQLLVAETLQNAWAEIGVIITIEEREWSELLENGEDSDFEIMRSGWMCDSTDPAAMLSVFTSGGNRNYSGWANEKFDKYISDAYKTTDAAEREGLLYKAEKLLFDDWVICPLFYYSDIYLQSSYLKGVTVSPLGYKSFVNAVINIEG